MERGRGVLKDRTNVCDIRIKYVTCQVEKRTKVQPEIPNVGC